MRTAITVFLTVCLMGICAANAAHAQDARTKPVETPMLAEQGRVAAVFDRGGLSHFASAACP